jgi:O-antigen ligase
MSPLNIRSHVATAWEWFLRGKGSGPIRLVVFVLLGMHIMKYAERSRSDPALWIAFVVAVCTWRRAPVVWRSIAGCTATAIVGLALVGLLFSVDPTLSARDFVKQLDILAAAIAIPVLLRSRARVETALMIAALGWTVVLGQHLVEMHRELGDAFIQSAHDFRPAAIVHANIESMFAGLAVFVLVHAAWRRRASVLKGVLLLVAAGGNLFYIYVIASRGPQIAFAATIVASGFVILPGWRAKAIWAAGMIVCGSVAWANLDKINERFDKVGTLDSLNDRDVVWTHTWHLAKSRPWIGHGYGKKVFVETYHSSDPPESPFDFQHPHQYWLYVFFSQGALGVALHIVLWLALLGRLVRAQRRAAGDGDRHLIGLLLLLAIYFQVYSMADWPGSVLWVIYLWLVVIMISVTHTEAAGRITAGDDNAT